MLFRIRRPWESREADVTPETLWLSRRRFLGSAAGAAVLAGTGSFMISNPAAAVQRGPGEPLPGVAESTFSTSEKLNTFEEVTTYNNFYEFGTGKEDPSENAGSLKTRPWTVEVDGEAGKPGVLDIETLLTKYPLEERIYRLRCVEGWSMVIPWVGVQLSEVLKAYEPTSKAKFVRFETLMDPEQMPGQQSGVLPWPYVEGLRMDEAMHPLAILGVGLYGQVLPNQNGAPVRLIVPWKYGFKSIKSVVRITFTETQPETTWNIVGPNEYGFYANVNPEVDHPRWSQAKERRIGDFFRRDTYKFNGYGEEVASLYSGMDLRKAF